MPLNSKFLSISTGEKTCENWSIFSKNIKNRPTIAYLFGPSYIRAQWFTMNHRRKLYRLNQKKHLLVIDLFIC